MSINKCDHNGCNKKAVFAIISQEDLDASRHEACLYSCKEHLGSVIIANTTVVYKIDKNDME